MCSSAQHDPGPRIAHAFLPLGNQPVFNLDLGVALILDIDLKLRERPSVADEALVLSGPAGWSRLASVWFVWFGSAPTLQVGGGGWEKDKERSQMESLRPVRCLPDAA
jgi:hypothetical protein